MARLVWVEARPWHGNLDRGVKRQQRIRAVDAADLFFGGGCRYRVISHIRAIIEITESRYEGLRTTRPHRLLPSPNNFPSSSSGVNGSFMYCGLGLHVVMGIKEDGGFCGVEVFLGANIIQGTAMRYTPFLEELLRIDTSLFFFPGKEKAWRSIASASLRHRGITIRYSFPRNKVPFTVSVCILNKVLRIADQYFVHAVADRGKSVVDLRQDPIGQFLAGKQCLYFPDRSG